MGKEEIKALEEAYAAEGIPVVSNASANRWTDDVPMLIPEINSAHLDIIKKQQAHHGWDKGFIAVKPNCSLQTYMMRACNGIRLSCKKNDCYDTSGSKRRRLSRSFQL